ncbi:sigma-54-dependent transcriptional regulator [Caldithrix abyssi]
MQFNQKINILLIEDEEYDVKRVQKTIAPLSDQIRIKKIVADGQSALEALKKSPNYFDVVIMDYQLLGGITGENLIRKIKEVDATLQIIVITKMTVNITDFDFANRLIEAGAMWYCTKYPGDIEDFIYQPTDFILSILNAFEKRRLLKKEQSSKRKLEQSIEELLQQKALIGESEAMRALRSKIAKIAQQEATVLILGESGTGKELVATHLHYLSRRRFEKFLTINCGSLPHDLIESELFGFEKGSFTGAVEKKIGLFEAANQGTLFLDEIGELPMSAQVKLLRVLQDGEIDKIGRTDKVKVDVRVVAATNKDLVSAVQQKTFREDLFYRLNVINLYIPPLRERKEDIPLLLEHFFKHFAHTMGVDVPQISSSAMDYLQGFDWPGNVRQLQNVVQRLLYNVDGMIDVSDVKDSLGLAPKSRAAVDSENGFEWDPIHITPWREIERAFRKKYFEFVRKRAASDAQAARLLGLAPPNFHRMCKELELK